MKRIAFYGGSFDPPHNGHLTIARKLTEVFGLDEFYFVPAFHAPHKKSKTVTSAFCRYAMLALATNADQKIKISTVELDAPERPFTFETQAKLIAHYKNSARILFVVGADSWNEITTWREWEKVLTQTDIIVVTRPNYDIELAHVTDKIRERIVQVQSPKSKVQSPKSKVQSQPEGELKSHFETLNFKPETKIYLTDAVQIDISATRIRGMIKAGETDWREFVPAAVAGYIEKYRLYI